MKNINYCFKCGQQLSKEKHEGRQRYYCTECGEIRFRNSVPVAGVFVVDDDRVLLIKRGNLPNRGKWSYPAGYLEYDEKTERGAVRELEEETSLEVEEEDLLLVSTIQLEHPDKYIVGNAYAADYSDTAGELEAGSDAQEARFWTLEEMEENMSKMESEKIIDAADRAIRLLS